MHMSDMHCSIITVWDLCACQTLTERERERETDTYLCCLMIK